MEFVKTGELPLELSKSLHRLFERRMEDDYQTITPVTKEEALEALQTASQFVKTIEEYLIAHGYFT